MIDHIYLTDNDENYAPPEKPILEVGLVGDVVFLSIGRYEETHTDRTFSAIDTVAVPVTDLANALKVLSMSQQRHDLKRALGSDRDIRPVAL